MQQLQIKSSPRHEEKSFQKFFFNHIPTPWINVFISSGIFAL